MIKINHYKFDIGIPSQFDDYNDMCGALHRAGFKKITTPRAITGSRTNVSFELSGGLVAKYLPLVMVSEGQFAFEWCEESVWRTSPTRKGYYLTNIDTSRLDIPVSHLTEAEES